MSPVNLELSVSPMEILGFWLRSYINNKCTPQLISPFCSPELVAGSKEIPISLPGIVPSEKRLSVTVGILSLVPGDKVPT